MSPEAQQICTAPAGMLRVVHHDFNDSWPCKEGDFDSLGAATRFIGSKLDPHAKGMKVYDEHGALVPFELV